MKKILFILSLLFSVVAYSQTTIPGYTNINSRYWWEAGLFKALGIPAGDSAQFRAGQAVRAGAQYYDSTGANAGLYMWTGLIWQRVDAGSQPQFCNDWKVPVSVTYEGGYDFALSEGEYNIDCLPYESDSASFTLDSADATYDRYDVFYVDATGLHVLEGTPEELATVPSLEAGQLFVAWVRIPANSLPDVSTVYIWRENVEWTGAQSGATVDFNNTANVHEGLKAINWTNVNNGDFITFTFSDTVNLSLYDAISVHPRLKQVIAATANLRIQWFLGTTAVSNEITLTLNKSSINQYQAVSMPMSLFTITNNNANRLRIRYTNNTAAIISGFYLDYIFLEQGLVIPGPPGSGSDITLTMPSPLFNVQNNNGDFVVTMPGSGSSIVNADGTTRTYDAVTGVGAYNSLGTHSNGAQVSGNNMIFHDGDGVDPGMIGAYDWRRFDSAARSEAVGLGNGLQVIRQVDPLTVGFRSLVFIGADTSASNDTTLIIEITGGGPGGSQTLQDVFDEEDKRALLPEADTIDINSGSLEIMYNTWSLNKFTLTQGHWLNASNESGDKVAGFLTNTTGGNIEFLINAQDNDNSKYSSLTVATEPTASYINATADTILLIHNNFVPIGDSANYYMAVTHKTNGTLGKAFWPAGGGGGGSDGNGIYDGSGSLTGNTVVDLDGNTLLIDGGKVGIGELGAGSQKYFIGGVTEGNYFYIDTADKEVYLSASESDANANILVQGLIAGANVSFNSTDGIGVAGMGIYSNSTNGYNAEMVSSDGTGNGRIRLTSDAISGYTLEYKVSNGTNEISIIGDAVTNLFTVDGAVLFDAGSTAAGSAYLYEQAGSLLTIAATGANEFDGIVKYFTTASGRGLVPSVCWSRLNADFPLSDVNTAQVCLPSTQDVITLQGGTTYEFEGQWNVLCGTASHAFGMGFAQGGSGTLDTIRYNTIGWAGVDNNTASVQATGRYVNITPNTLQMAASAVGGNNVIFRGIIVVAPGDPITLTPQIIFGAAPGGTNLMKRGSYIKFTPIGSNTVTVIGNVN